MQTGNKCEKCPTGVLSSAALCCLSGSLRLHRWFAHWHRGGGEFGGIGLRHCSGRPGDSSPFSILPARLPSPPSATSHRTLPLPVPRCLWQPIAIRTSFPRHQRTRWEHSYECYHKVLWCVWCSCGVTTLFVSGSQMPPQVSGPGPDVGPHSSQSAMTQDRGTSHQYNWVIVD